MRSTVRTNVLTVTSILAAASLVLLALVATGPPVNAAKNPNSGILPLQSHPYGRTYGEWVQQWWT